MDQELEREQRMTLLPHKGSYVKSPTNHSDLAKSDPASHVFNFPRAIARWLSLFFFSPSISANVMPSNSKIASQPRCVSINSNLLRSRQRLKYQNQLVLELGLSFPTVTQLGLSGYKIHLKPTVILPSKMIGLCSGPSQ